MNAPTLALPAIGLFATHATTFLCGFSLLGLLALGLPMMLMPVRWARTLGWAEDGATDLAIYFARSLGMVVTCLSVLGMAISPYANALPAFFNLTMAMCAGAGVVHIVGWAQGRQPLQETLEIPVWFALAATTYLFYPLPHWVLC